MTLPGWLIWGCIGDLHWVIQRTHCNSDISELLSLLGGALGIQNPRTGRLDSFSRCRSLKEESCQAKIIKEEGRERVRVRKRELMTSDFLRPVSEISVFALILVSWIPRIISMSLPFPWSQLELGFSQFLFRLGSRSFIPREAPICFSTITSETLYSLLRIGYVDHQIQFISILGRSALSLSEGVLGVALLIPESLQALHCLCQANPVISSIINREVLPQEDDTQDPVICRCTLWVRFKIDRAVMARMLGESETHICHPEPLSATPPTIQTEQHSWFYFPLLVSIKWFYELQGMWEFIQNQKGPINVAAMRKGVVTGGLAVQETVEW